MTHSSFELKDRSTAEDTASATRCRNNQAREVQGTSIYLLNHGSPMRGGKKTFEGTGPAQAINPFY